MLGSGMTFHNMRAFFAGDKGPGPSEVCSDVISSSSTEMASTMKHNFQESPNMHVRRSKRSGAMVHDIRMRAVCAGNKDLGPVTYGALYQLLSDLREANPSCVYVTFMVMHLRVQDTLVRLGSLCSAWGPGKERLDHEKGIGAGLEPATSWCASGCCNEQQRFSQSTVDSTCMHAHLGHVTTMIMMILMMPMLMRMMQG